MAAPDYIIKHGTGTLVTRLETERTADGFDSGTFEAHSAAENTFAIGGAMPTYSGMIVTRCRNSEDGDGEYMHEGTAIGLRSGTTRLIETDADLRAQVESLTLRIQSETASLQAEEAA